jgi:hypothetical protein
MNIYITLELYSSLCFEFKLLNSLVVLVETGGAVECRLLAQENQCI